MNGVVAYALAKNIAASAVSGVKNYTVDGTTLKIETNDGNVLDMVFPVPTGIDKGYYNDENGKFYQDSKFKNEIAGKTDVVYIDHGQNRICFWDGEKFDAIGGDAASPEDIITSYSDLENKPKIAGVTLVGNKSLSDFGIQGTESGKGLSTNDYTNEEKAKLASLSNYNDTSLSNRITTVESSLSGKVNKVTGKGLSANDYTDEEKAKLAGLSNYDDTALSGRISNLEDVVPNSASSSNKLATLEDIPSGPNGTTNYNSLENKPQIGGVTLTGDKSLEALGIQPAEENKGLSTNDFTDAYKSKLDNLSNYDDTTLSGRVTTVEGSLSNKVDKDGEKGLSTNDYDNTEKQKVADAQPKTLATPITVEGVQQTTVEGALGAINNKSSGGTDDYDDLTNKPQIAGTTLSGNKTLAELGIQASESGKGLSTEDYTTAEKTKLAGLSNYDDTALSGRVSDIEDVVPSTATTSNKLATMSDVTSGGGFAPIGTEAYFDGNTTPTGWLICDGSTKNISDYPGLAAYFQTQHGSKSYYGGNGSTTFGLPKRCGMPSGSDYESTTEHIVGVDKDRKPIYERSYTGSITSVNTFITIDSSFGTTRKLRDYHGSITASSINAAIPYTYASSVNVGQNVIVANVSGSLQIKSMSDYFNGQTYIISVRYTKTTDSAVSWGKSADKNGIFCIKATVSGHIYSTTEQQVGVWIDNKTLYEKVVSTGGAVPSGATEIYRESFTGYDVIGYTKS